MNLLGLSCRSLLILGAGSLLGCSVLGTALIPAHPRSEMDAKPLRVSIESPPAGIQAIPAALVPIAAELAAKAIVAGIEIEAQRYKATYSGRASGVLGEALRVFVLRCEGAPTGVLPELTCGADETLLRFVGKAEVASGGLRFTVTDYDVRGAKAKLAWPSFRTAAPAHQS
jgi:hypothetical protein